mmetsp:Transcript_83592/g.255441  ORF Transcript_83592/g.255441 Transcript_83592/m.255441 type:complete len:345 (+) Transcript_83592:110-1144(+)
MRLRGAGHVLPPLLQAGDRGVQQGHAGPGRRRGLVQRVGAAGAARRRKRVVVLRGPLRPEHRVRPLLVLDLARQEPRRAIRVVRHAGNLTAPEVAHLPRLQELQLPCRRRGRKGRPDDPAEHGPLPVLGLLEPRGARRRGPRFRRGPQLAEEACRRRGGHQHDAADEDGDRHDPEPEARLRQRREHRESAMHRQGVAAVAPQQARGSCDPRRVERGEHGHVRDRLAIPDLPRLRHEVVTAAEQHAKPEGGQVAARQGRERREHGLAPDGVQQEPANGTHLVPEQRNPRGDVLERPGPIPETVRGGEPEHDAEEHLRALEADVHRQRHRPRGLPHQDELRHEVWR